MILTSLIDGILAREGWPMYTDDPADSGGPTKGGITQATLAAWRGHPVTAEDVQRLTESEARSIYLERYWKAPGFQRVAALDQDLAEELADTGVNMGQATAIRFLQRFLTAFNDRGRIYPDLAVDGVLGPVTLEALRSFLLYRRAEGKRVLWFCLDAVQTVRYVEIAEQREKDEHFVYGQILQRAAAHWITEGAA